MGLRELQNRLIYELEKSDEELAKRKLDMNDTLEKIKLPFKMRKAVKEAKREAKRKKKDSK